MLLRVGADLSRFQVRALVGVDVLPERIGREDFAAGPIDYIQVAGALGADDYLAQLAGDRHVEQDELVDRVVVEQIVRHRVIEPACVARVGVAREDAVGPLVVACSLMLVPGPGIGRAVVDEIELGIVGEPTLHCATADLPSLRRPRFHAQVRAALGIAGSAWVCAKAGNSDARIAAAPVVTCARRLSRNATAKTFIRSAPVSKRASATNVPSSCAIGALGRSLCATASEAPETTADVD